MKTIKRILPLVFLSLLCCGAWAQKYACVNTEYILQNVPDYRQAQAQLDKIAAQWQKELETLFQEVERMSQNYQQEGYLLPEALKAKREQELRAKESEAKALQRKRFGPGGDLDKKRMELVRPVQDKIYNAIERIANERGYSFIMDKAGSATVLYVNPKYDISDQVLEMMGYKPGATAGENADKNGKSNSKSQSRN
ncbi:MAG: OmpH family outer membrane protein [Bacteroidales bacterium]|nr:OmpH family outer membrane protein [Bacteroidales bacterium]